MILYNVTVSIDTDVETDWVAWMKDKHIPDILNTGMFVSARIFKVLNEEEAESTSYAVQYLADSMEHIEIYKQRYAPALQEEHHARFRGKYAAFRTLLEAL